MSVELADVRSVVARAALLMMLAAAMLLLPELTHDPALQAVIPGMCLFLFLLFAPALWTRSPDLFAPPIYFGIVGAFGTAATVASWIVNDELTLDLVRGVRTDELVDLAQQAMLVQIVGLLAYYVGYYTRLGIRWQRIFPKLQGLAWDRSRLLLVCFVTGAVFIATYGVFQSRVGVSLFDFTQLGAGKRVWRDDPTLSWMMRGIEIGFLPVMLFLSHALSARRGPRSLILPAVVLAILALLGSRVGQRGAVIYVLVTILIQFHYHRWRVPTWLFAALCFVAITSSNILREWRNAPDDEQRSFDLVTEAKEPLEVLAEHESERQRFSAVVLIMKEFPENEPFLMGKSWTSLAVLFVPRWIWPDKVNYFEWQDDRIIIKLVGSNTPAPYYAVFYANFWWLGVIFGPLLFGMFHRGLYEWLRRGGRDRNTVLLYSLFLVYFGPSMLHVSVSIQYILPTWLILKFVSRPADGSPEVV